VNARRSLLILFGLALVAPWVAPADPCAPVCECCPCCLAQSSHADPPCHSGAGTSTSPQDRDCTDCLKAAPGLPDAVVQAAMAPTLPDAPAAVLPPAADTSALAAGVTVDPTTSPPETNVVVASVAPRAPPSCS
jgi:hypothetical protein